MDFDSLDGKPATIIVLTLSPRTTPAPHVQFMAAVSQKLDATGRERLLNCRTAQDMLGVLTAPNGNVA